MSFLNHLISGISLGSIYAIIALGYTMVYGIAKMLNFAHGDVIMVGGVYVLLRDDLSRLAGMDGCRARDHRLHGARHGDRKTGLQAAARGSVARRSDHGHRRFLLPPECGAADLDLQPQELQLGRHRRRDQACSAVSSRFPRVDTRHRVRLRRHHGRAHACSPARARSAPRCARYPRTRARRS